MKWGIALTLLGEASAEVRASPGGFIDGCGGLGAPLLPVSIHASSLNVPAWSPLSLSLAVHGTPSGRRSKKQMEWLATPQSKVICGSMMNTRGVVLSNKQNDAMVSFFMLVHDTSH